jgi:REP element-mobilizing transposase RayT
MARMPRLVVPGYPHHATQCGNRRQRTFPSEDNYRHYITLLSESAREAETEIWAYCLMPNHGHLVMVPSTEDGLRATGPNRSASTIELAVRLAVPNSSKPSSNKPAKPWHPNAPAPNHTQRVRYTVPGIARNCVPGIANLFQKFRHYCVELFRILQVHYMPCIRGYKQL